MKIFCKLVSLAAIALLASCGPSTLENGFYVQDDGTPFSCITFEIRNDSILWKNQFNDTIPKIFVYSLSGGKLEGKCEVEDERMEKECELLEDSGIVLAGVVFRKYNPFVTHVPEGEYENYLCVPKNVENLVIKGDSAHMKHYRYEELLNDVTCSIKLKGYNKVILADEKSSREVNFQIVPNGFIIDETRYSLLKK